MFTGIIQAKGKITSVQELESGITQIQVEHDLNSEFGTGESIAINGCCLTITSGNKNQFSFEVLSQTIRVTNFNELKIGSFINIEPAITAAEMLSGHIVSGHVDCTAEVHLAERRHGEYRLGISISDEFSHLVIDKGSICINGISLTIASLKDEENKTKIECSIIPETIKRTNIPELQLGDHVNIEFDLIGKYVHRAQALKK